MANEIGDQLARYLAERDRERDNRVDRSLNALTNRERALVREAAVMGYVQGAMAAHPSAKPDIPRDWAIVWSVIDACRAHADLYPTISALADDGGEVPDA